MEPLNLSSMEWTPAEHRAALDDEYQAKIWHLTEKFPITKEKQNTQSSGQKIVAGELL